MSKLIVSIDGVVVKEAQLTRARSTLGRRPYNDIVLDHLAVSGEHAVVHLLDGDAVIEDLGSTNGTLVNGRAVRKQVLAGEDVIEIGRYNIRYVDGSNGTRPSVLMAETGDSDLASDFGHDSDLPVDATEVEDHAPKVRVLSGPSAGREIHLTKRVTTLGKRGISVAAIQHGDHGYELHHVEGKKAARVNGVSVAEGSIVLQNRDRIEIGAVRLEYSDS